MNKINTFSKNKPETRQPQGGIDEYLAKLDELLKKNTGAFTNFGFDTSSNNPYLLAGARKIDPEGENVFSRGYDLGQDTVPTASSYDTAYSRANTQPTTTQNYSPSRQSVNASEFLKQLNKSSQPTAIAQMEDGGILYSNNVVFYEDDSYREVREQNATAIAQMRDGSIQYSDGTIRKPAPVVVKDFGNGRALFSDGAIRTIGQLGIDTTGTNLVQLQRALFSGQEFPITQEYDNYNPELGYASGRHSGLDIGVSNQSLTLPFRAKVIELLQDDGTRYGDYTKHKGYGNSILVQLETGEMLRFSHLSQANVQAGQIIEAGTTIGVTGNTGNSTGDHLDLEYYDQNGRITDPQAFSGLTNPELMKDSKIAGQVVSRDELSDEELNIVNDYARENLSSQMPEGENPREVGHYDPTRGRVLGNNDSRMPIEKRIAEIGISYGLAERGLSEAVGRVESGIQNTRDTAGNRIDQTGRNLNLPNALNAGEIVKGEQDTGLSEFATGNLPSAVSKASDYVAGTAKRAGVDRDFGLNEFFRGDFKEAGQNFIESFKPEPAYADSDSNSQDMATNQPISQKTNRNLVADKILTGLDQIKQRVFGDNTYKPTENQAPRIIGDANAIGDRGQVLGVKDVSSEIQQRGNSLPSATDVRSVTRDRSVDNTPSLYEPPKINLSSSVFSKASSSNISNNSNKSVSTPGQDRKVSTSTPGQDKKNNISTPGQDKKINTSTPNQDKKSSSSNNSSAGNINVYNPGGISKQTENAFKSSGYTKPLVSNMTKKSEPKKSNTVTTFLKNVFKRWF